MANRKRRMTRLWKELRTMDYEWFIVGILLFGFALTDVLIEQHIPESLWYREAGADAAKKPWVPLLQVGSGGIGAVGVLVASVQRGLKQTRARQGKDRNAVKLRLATIARSLFSRLLMLDDQLRWDELTVRFYCIDRRQAEPRLKVVAEATFTNRQPSGIVWTKGKGAIGRAWETNQSQVLNLAHRKLKAASNSEAAWSAAPPETTGGLTWQEISVIKNQGYGAVAAIPIRHETDVIGVLALDAPPGHFLFLASSDANNEALAAIQYARDDLADLWRSYET